MSFSLQLLFTREHTHTHTHSCFTWATKVVDDSKTDVTPAIFSLDFVAQLLYSKKKLRDC